MFIDNAQAPTPLSVRQVREYTRASNLKNKGRQNIYKYTSQTLSTRVRDTI